MSVQRGQTFSIDIKIDTEGECINTIEGSLAFSNNLLQVVNFSTGSSILSLWPMPPEVNQLTGVINFIGGAPGGYCGEIAGNPGQSDIVGRIFFRSVPDAISTSPPKISFLPGTQVLLHDGLGTSANLIATGAEMIVTGELSTDNQWQEELKNDKISPEAFGIILSQDPSVFDGQYFISFSTTDKQTGIDYYEVREMPQKIAFRPARWIKTNSPYLLQDQSLQSIIEVRAVDKAGNKRIAEIRPEYNPTWTDWLPWIALILLAGIGWLIVKIKNKK